jgi:hypothetical protein
MFNVPFRTPSLTVTYLRRAVRLHSTMSSTVHPAVAKANDFLDFVNASPTRKLHLKLHEHLLMSA